MRALGAEKTEMLKQERLEREQERQDREREFQKRLQMQEDKLCTENANTENALRKELEHFFEKETETKVGQAVQRAEKTMANSFKLEWAEKPTPTGFVA